MSIETRSISPQLEELLEKLKSSVLNSLAVYEEFVETARHEGFNDSEINMLLKHHLKGIIPDSTLRYYGKKYLQLEDKKKKDIEDSYSQSQQLSEIEDKKDIEDSSISSISREAQQERYTPSSELEEFRKQHGETIIKEDVEIEFPPIAEEPDTTYDKDFVEGLIKENAELKQKLEKFSFEYDLELRAEILPLKVDVYPLQRTGLVRVRKQQKSK